MRKLRGGEPVDRHPPRRERGGRSWREPCCRRRRRVVPAPATITLLGGASCAGLVALLNIASSVTEGAPSSRCRAGQARRLSRCRAGHRTRTCVLDGLSGAAHPVGG